MSSLFSRIRSAGMRVAPLIVQKGLSGGAPLLIGLYIAHEWALVEAGRFTVVYSMIAIAVVVADWGCIRFLPRELSVSLANGRGSAVEARLNTLRAATALLAVAACAVWVYAGTDRAGQMPYLFALAPLPFLSILTTNGLSTRIARSDISAVTLSIPISVATFFAIWFMAGRSRSGPILVVIAFVISRLAEAVVLVGMNRSAVSAALRGVGKIARTMLPFNVQAILAIVYARIPVLVGAATLTAQEVGALSVALAVQGVLMLLPASFALLEYPSLSVAASVGDMRRVQSLVWRHIALTSSGVVAGLAVLLLERGWILALLRVPPSFQFFVIAFAATALTTVGTSIAGFTLLALGGESEAARLSVVTMCMAAVLQIILATRLGLTGMLIAYVLYELLSIALFMFASWKRARGVRVMLEEASST